MQKKKTVFTLGTNQVPMNLKLSVGGKVLASIPLDPNYCQNDYYLKAFRRQLIIRYRLSIAKLKRELEFIIEAPPLRKTL